MVALGPAPRGGTAVKGTTPRDDRVTWLARLLLTPVIPLGAVFGPLLFLWPQATDQYFAWTIMPPMSAVFIGAGFIFAVLALSTLLRNGRWHALSTPMIGAWALSTAMLGATVLHWDHFRRGTLPFYLWLTLYIVLPLGLPIAYRLNQSRDPSPEPGQVEVAPPFRLAMIVGGIVLTTLGLGMFMIPSYFDQLWPWRLTPLTSRVIAGWFLLPGIWAGLAYDEKRYSAYRPLLRIGAIWPGLILAGSILHRDEFAFDRPLAGPWFIAVAAVCVAIVVMYRYHERLYRSHA